MPDNKLCLSCGACCAHYRVSFYWAEADDFTCGGVPVELTERLSSLRIVMKGTNQPNPYCSALMGELGHRVECAIYLNRPQVCRNLHSSWSAGRADEKCDQARMSIGLAPLELEYIC